MQRANSLEKALMLGKTEVRRRRGQQRTRWLYGITNNGQEFEQAPGNGEGQGSLVCCSSWGHSVRQDWVTEQQLLHARLSRPSLSLGVCSNSCPLSRWYHPIISSFVIPFSWLQSFPASGSFRMSWLFESGSQNIGASASASGTPMTIQGWFPLGLTALISLQSKGFSRVRL